MIRVAVDQGECGTTGQCALLAPGVFRQRPDGVAEVIVDEPPAQYHGDVRAAWIGCPVGAILMTEDDEPT